MRRTFIVGLVATSLAGTFSALAQEPRLPAPTAGAGPRLNPPRVLPGTPRSAFGTVEGAVLDSIGSPLTANVVRLRDARYGRVTDTQLSNRAGRFTFSNVDPGLYVVELVGPNRSVVTTSGLLSLEGGDVRSVTLKMPLAVGPLLGLLGHTTSNAGLVTAAAAAAGVMSVAVTNNAISPQ